MVTWKTLATDGGLKHFDFVKLKEINTAISSGHLLLIYWISNIWKPLTQIYCANIYKLFYVSTHFSFHLLMCQLLWVVRYWFCTYIDWIMFKSVYSVVLNRLQLVLFKEGLWVVWGMLYRGWLHFSFIFLTWVMFSFRFRWLLLWSFPPFLKCLLCCKAALNQILLLQTYLCQYKAHKYVHSSFFLAYPSVALHMSDTHWYDRFAGKHSFRWVFLFQLFCTHMRVIIFLAALEMCSFWDHEKTNYKSLVASDFKIWRTLYL